MELVTVCNDYTYHTKVIYLLTYMGYLWTRKIVLGHGLDLNITAVNFEP